MDASAITFSRRSAGVGGEGPVVRYEYSPPGDGWAWALVSACLPAMLSAGGSAFAEFLLEAGGGHVALLVAPDWMDPTKGTWAGSGEVMECWMVDGGVIVDGSRVRDCTSGWGAPMAPGETVRVRYVAATRMVSVVWRGEEYELRALSTSCDVACYRFGVGVSRGSTLRLTGASCCRYHLPHVRWLLRTRVMCQAGRAHAAEDAPIHDTASWLCARAPLWVFAQVCALL
jgi:hypothetical protein